MTAIFELIDKGDADGIRTLLAADPTARDARDDTGVSPLMHAAYAGRGPTSRHSSRPLIRPTPRDRLIRDMPKVASHDHGARRLHSASSRRLRSHRPSRALLAEAGADPTSSRSDVRRGTPLGTCAFANDPDAARVAPRSTGGSLDRRERALHAEAAWRTVTRTWPRYCVRRPPRTRPGEPRRATSARPRASRRSRARRPLSRR